MIFHPSLAYLVHVTQEAPKACWDRSTWKKNMTDEKWDQFLQLGF